MDEWANGNLVNLGPATNLRIKGSYAIWWTDTSRLFRRDLATGTTLTVATRADSGDVAPNGDVVYLDDQRSGAIDRYRNGETVQVVDGADSNFVPATDGTNIVYAVRTPCGALYTCYTIMEWDANGTQVIGPSRRGAVTAGRDYQIDNGWVAITKPAPDGTLQAWLTSPSWQSTQLSFFGSSNWIDAINAATSQATFINGTRRYLGGPQFTTVDMSSKLGHAVYQNGQWFIFIGRTLFQVTL